MQGSTAGQDKLIVVLGAHRSGTSAITRALTVLGVELGNNHLPADYRNEKGYWEDQDIQQFNDEILSSLSSEWHHLSPISPDSYQTLMSSGYYERAAEMLGKKCDGFDVYGIKDPRMTKLLPFWIEVFGLLGRDVRFVIALRHPLSVAKSLQKRDGFDRRHGYHLWFVYMALAAAHSTRYPSVIVDYDKLLAQPECQIERMAEACDLRANPERLTYYVSEFLDVSLRHSVGKQSDLVQDADCPGPIQRFYPKLRELAAQSGVLDNRDVAPIKQLATAALTELELGFADFDRQLRIQDAAKRVQSERPSLRRAVRVLLEIVPGGEAILRLLKK